MSAPTLAPATREQHGDRFERAAVERWLDEYGGRCPISGTPLSRRELRADEETRAAIKQRKLDELEDGGIPAKYRAELAKKKIGA